MTTPDFDDYMNIVSDREVARAMAIIDYVKWYYPNYGQITVYKCETCRFTDANGEWPYMIVLLEGGDKVRCTNCKQVTNARVRT